MQEFEGCGCSDYRVCIFLKGDMNKGHLEPEKGRDSCNCPENNACNFTSRYLLKKKKISLGTPSQGPTKSDFWGVGPWSQHFGKLPRRG